MFGAFVGAICGMVVTLIDWELDDLRKQKRRIREDASGQTVHEEDEQLHSSAMQRALDRS